MSSPTPPSLRQPIIRLFQDNRIYCLTPGANDFEIHEKQVMFSIDGCEGCTVSFDDDVVPTFFSEGRQTQCGYVDLTNCVGYHRFHIAAAKTSLSYDFFTSTTKATRREIEAMVSAVSQQAYAFRRQFVYTNSRHDSVELFSAELLYGWIRERAPELFALASEVVRSPASEPTTRFALSRAGGRVSVSRTAKLLRERNSLLEESDDGPLLIAERRYWPSIVVCRKSTRRLARIEHLQLAQLLSRLLIELSRIDGEVSSAARSDIESWRTRALALKSSELLQRFDAGSTSSWSATPTVLQLADRRYGRLHAIHSEFLRGISTGERQAMSTRVNLRDVWDIYQAFCAHMVGRALRLNYTTARADLSERDSNCRSMQSDRYDLFYNVVPPSDVIQSWRSASLRPGEERPDIIIRDKKSGKVALMDVKFRIHSGTAKNEDYAVIQAYLNSFGLTRGAVIFPGAAASFEEITDGKNSLLGIPLRAQDFLEDHTAAAEILKLRVEKVFC